MRTISLPKHIPALDGLRGIAILAVMGFHLDMPGFNLGWAGVNLFFVISGFLITGILLDAKESPHYFKNFYIRRSLRIFPIYYLTLACVLILSQVQSAYGDHTIASYRDWPYYLFYMQNYVLGINGFKANFPGLANHTWSLAIEEQFYLLWPAVVYFFNKKTLSRIVIGLFFFSIGARVVMWLLLENPHLLQTSLFTQLDALATGSFLTILVRSTKLTMAKLVSRSRVIGITFLGLVIISLSVVVPVISLSFDFNIVFYSFLAVLFGGMVFETVLNDGYFARIMRTPALMYVGKISYGLYLYHFPVFWLTKAVLVILKLDGIGFWFESGLQLLITFVVAAISWRVIEKPLLALKERWANQETIRAEHDLVG